MKSKPTTKEQLIREVTRLQKRVSTLEAKEAKHKQTEELLRKNEEQRVKKRTAALRTTNKKLREEIARRKESEEIVRDSEERYRQLMESANDAIFIADADTGIIITANQKAEELLGRPLADIIGMHQTQFHAEEDADHYGKVFKEHVRRGKGIILEDVLVCHKNGKKIPTSVSASVTQFRGKRIIQGIFRNITDRKKAEQEIKEGKAFLESVIESSRDGIAITDEKGTILSVNSVLTEMSIFSKEELMGKHISILARRQSGEGKDS